MKVCITGARGFVGQHMVHEMKECGWDVHELVHDITHPYTRDDVYDVIIHAAGCPSSKICINNPERAIYTNIIGTFHMLEYARRIGAKFVLFSSCEVYGSSDGDVTEDTVLKSYNMYGASKVACEHMCQAYYHSYGVESIILRLINTWGPGCQSDRFPSIIKRRFETEDTPHFVLHDRSKKRWLHIETMAERVCTIIPHIHGCETYNLVGDENLMLHEFIQKFGSHFTYEYKPVTTPGYNSEHNACGNKLTSFVSKSQS